MYKISRIQLEPAYCVAGPHRVCDLLFVGGLSCGAPDEATIAKLDAIGARYDRIPYHDPDDVARIAELEAALEKKGGRK